MAEALPRGAMEVLRSEATNQTVQLARGPAIAGQVERIEATGTVITQVWQAPQTEPSTAALLTDAADALEASGYEVLFTCATQSCGGFDFRMALEVAPGPEMFVDLGDFRYALARHPEDETHVALLVSRGTQKAYIQRTTVQPPGSAPLPMPVQSTRTPRPDGVLSSGMSFEQKLAAAGAAILDDLDFPSGRGDLAEGSYASLTALAAWLNADPGQRVLLVGHTDNEGELSRNIELSEQRAQSVAQRLVTEFGIAADRIEARGIGFMAPRASNATPEGRRTNRRVEVVALTPLTQ